MLRYLRNRARLRSVMPLLGVKRTSVAPSPMSAYDPKRTFIAH
jgi:hypothetical protein